MRFSKVFFVMTGNSVKTLRIYFL